MNKIQWRDINGVLLLDKPAQLSSNDALQKARRVFRARKGGHGGTLDPLATGLLPIALGQATKFINDLVDAPKVYLADIRLGATSNTGDEEGEITASASAAQVAQISLEQVREALAGLTGEIDQQPPMYSALKHKGKPLYHYARKGVDIERPTRRITIFRLDLLSCDILDKAQIQVRVECTKGTYIRVLAEDIGRALECGAYLKKLRREAVGQFSVEHAHSLIDLTELSQDDQALLGSLAPVDAMLADLPRCQVAFDDADKFLHGQPIALSQVDTNPANIPDGSRCRVYAEQQFLGLAAIENNYLAPRRLMVGGLTNPNN